MSQKVILKTLGLLIFTLFFGVLFWQAVKKVTQLPLVLSPGTQWGILLSVLFFSVFIALVAIFCILIKNLAHLLSALFIFNLPYFLFFSFDIFALIIILLTTLIFWYFAFTVRGEMNARLKFSALKVTHFGLRLVILVVFFSISLCYYGLMSSRGNTSEGVLDNVVNTTHQLTLNILEGRLKNFEPQATLDEFVATIDPMELFNIVPQVFLPSDFQKDFFKNLGIPEEELRKLQEADKASEVEKILSAEAEKQFREEFGQQIKEQLSNQLGIKLTGSETVSETLLNLIKRESTKNLAPFEKYIPFILSLVLFLILLTFTWLFALLIRLFISFFMTILLATNFVKIEKEVKPAEVLTLE